MFVTVLTGGYLGHAWRRAGRIRRVVGIVLGWAGAMCWSELGHATLCRDTWEPPLNHNTWEPSLNHNTWEPPLNHH